MSALTKNERDGLDEVFMSIHGKVDKYEKIKEISTLIFSKETKSKFEHLFKQANIGIKDSKFTQYLLDFSKKKKNLSK